MHDCDKVNASEQEEETNFYFLVFHNVKVAKINSIREKKRRKKDKVHINSSHKSVSIFLLTFNMLQSYLITT